MRPIVLLPLLAALVACSSSTATDDVTACAEEACANATDTNQCIADAKDCATTKGYTSQTVCIDGAGLEWGTLDECLKKAGFVK